MYASICICMTFVSKPECVFSSSLASPDQESKQRWIVDLGKELGKKLFRAANLSVGATGRCRERRHAVEGRLPRPLDEAEDL